MATNKQVLKIIKPLASARYQVDVFWYDIERSLSYYEEEYGGLDVNPDFQRGHVWTLRQQEHFIENVLRGIIPSSGLVIQWNCPTWDDYHYKGPMFKGFQCIDGLQRLTAVRLFVLGKIKPFGLSLDDLKGTNFDARRCLWHLKFAVYGLTKRKDLLSHYLDLNTGGTDHTEEEINRVKQLLENSN